jgi:hypothetical protein
MPSLALRSLFSGCRVDASQAKVRALLTAFLPVALDLPPLACITGFGDAFLNWLIHGNGSCRASSAFVTRPPWGQKVWGWQAKMRSSTARL